MKRVLVSGEIGSSLEPLLTVEGVQELIEDLTIQYGRRPTALLVSEYDRRNLNQRVMSEAENEVERRDQVPEHDRIAIAYILGVAIVASKEISRGKARPVFDPYTITLPDHGGGSPKIIIGA